MSQWILGVDVRGRCQGAAAFARWWAAHSESQGSVAPRFQGLHVHDASSFPPPDRYEAYDQLLATVKEHADKAVRSLHDERIPVKWVESAHPSEALLAEARSSGAAGLVVGRKARRGEVGLVRLGTVARQLVRHLERPTIVVPRDWEAKHGERGPVLLATDLADDAVGAAAFAKQFAAAVARPLVVVHVMRGIDRYIVAGEQANAVREHLIADGRKRVEPWLATHGIAGADLHVLPGDPIERVLTTAEDLDPVLLVCGSRQLSTAARLITTSLGATLSAAAPCPVALVPPS